MPDARVTLPSFIDSGGDTTWIHMTWRRYDPSGRIIYAEAYFDTVELKKVFYDVNGVGLMKSMIAYFERQRIFAFDGPKMGAKYVGNDGKRSYIKFKWEGEDLVMDNKDIVRPHDNMIPELNIHVEMALKMGWLEKKDGGGYDLGPNLQVEFIDDVIPNISAAGDIKDKDGKYVFWNVHSDRGDADFLTLSIYCNWRFLNLNEAFEMVLGDRSRSVLVYTNAGGRSVVGNQVTDLLRQVNLIRSGNGTQYFDPVHIQYIPVRSEVLDIIEVQVAEATGELTTFGAGNTIVTLHFMKS